ncbi:HEAT repeat domain-containing protein [Leptolyngbya sp. FACHB-711]|uniref:NACHT domain-containing protein n=1 Tax=Leptolyngbya sp. FACHB-711 TaxID=2692813 RepID=UPI00168619F6|nr:HEAT repeat domain-containing protein [Leptolyngbya sp. FACHB-711]MBD2024277.1 HEAT repeat domain-containing protein [Leptolyngbya sp. FACHB-711]
MTLETAALVRLLSPVAIKAAPALFKAVHSKLNPTELEKALREGMVMAQAQEEKQPPGHRLFSKYEPDFIPKFLHQFFQDSGVQAELQKPLTGAGMPDNALLEKKFLQVAKQKNVELIQSRVMPWIKEFTSTYFEQTNSYLKFQVAKERYFEQLIHCFDDVRFAGIAVEGQEIERAEKLAEIFVMPNVQGKAQTEFSFLEQGLPLEVQGDLQAQLLWEQRNRSRFASRQTSQPKISAAQLLKPSQVQRVVLLGAPGSGKTTLMSYCAVMLAQGKPELVGLDKTVDWLPILIKIRDLMKQPEINILQYARQMVKADLGLELPPEFFEHWLKDGRALILLDGLDEVAEEARRYKVVERIESFLGTHRRNPAIITSRPAGYKPDFFRTDEFPHYEILPFDDDQIQAFIDHWYESRFATKAEAQRRKESLRKALAESDRIKLLARNPLLLTIIALIHRYQAVLPKERHKLYDKAVNTLLTSWDANKELSNHEILEYLELDDLRRLMERLAYWIHSQGGTGDNEGGTLIDRDELLDQLAQYIQEMNTQRMKKVNRHQAKAEAKRFLDRIIGDRAGLLSKQGRDRYAFVHKTFQEYLTTQEIRDRQEEDFEVVLEHIQDHLHDPHWREVLLLLIAQQKRSNPAKILKEIFNQPTPYEQWLHRNLLFAGICLAENIEVTDESLVQEILKGLVELEANRSPLVPDVIQRRVFKVLCSLSETGYEALALQQLEAVGEAIDKVRLSRYRAALGKPEEAVQQLILLLKDEDSNVRSGAASALGQLGQASESVMTTLLPLLKDEESRVRYSAAWALGELGQASESVVATLLPLLKDEGFLVRSSAVWALGQLGKALGSTAIPNPTTIALAQWIDQNQESEYVSHGITALWNILRE